jgi:Bacterial aa3 type cytochrome c oxidase subunit IV
MLTTMDAETERHRQTWLGFCRFMRIMVVLIVLLLIGMALFLV